MGVNEVRCLLVVGESGVGGFLDRNVQGGGFAFVAEVGQGG